MCERASEQEPAKVRARNPLTHTTHAAHSTLRGIKIIFEVYLLFEEFFFSLLQQLQWLGVFVFSWD